MTVYQWNTGLPSTDETMYSHGINGNEGNMTISNFTTVNAYWPGYRTTADRQFLRIKGVRYLDNEGVLNRDLEEVENNCWNNYIARHNEFYRRLMYMQYLYKDYPQAFMPGWQVQGDGCLNWCNVFMFTASGSGATISVSFDSTTGGSSIPQLVLWPNRINSEEEEIPIYAKSAVQPGLMIMDNREGYGRSAIIKDVIYTSATTADLTLTNTLNPNGYVWIVREQFIMQPPILNTVEFKNLQKKTNLYCKYAIPTNLQMFKTFKTHFPNSFTADGIYYTETECWYCAKMDNGGVDLSTFEANSGKCKNVFCPYYTDLTQQSPNLATFSDAMWAAGAYTKQLMTGIGGAANLRIGREKWQGLWNLCGMPQCDYKYLGPEEHKDYLSFGALQKNTGYKDNGFYQYENLEQTYERLQVNDYDGFMINIKNALDNKTDPAGGINWALRDLIEDENLRYNHSYDTCQGMRSAGNINCGEPKAPYTWGYSQRVRPRNYTSTPFYASKPNVFDIDETKYDGKLTVYETDQIIKGVENVKVKFEVPRFQENKISDRTKHVKTLCTGKVKSVENYGNYILKVNFHLGTETVRTVVAPPGGPVTVGQETFSWGGNVVQPYAAVSSTNPDSNRKVGDPNAYLRAGDTIKFSKTGFTSPNFYCLHAAPFIGELIPEDIPNGIVYPNDAFPGLKNIYLSTFEGNRRGWSDSCLIYIGGTNGNLLTNINDLEECDIEVSYNGIIPCGIQISFDENWAPIIDEEASLFYVPTIYLVNAQTQKNIRDLTYQVDWWYEPADGEILIKSNVFEDYPYTKMKLYYEGFVYDVLKRYPEEEMDRMHDLMDAIVDTGMIGAGGAGPAAISISLSSFLAGDPSWLEVPPVDPENWSGTGSFVFYDYPNRFDTWYVSNSASTNVGAGMEPTAPGALISVGANFKFKEIAYDIKRYYNGYINKATIDAYFSSANTREITAEIYSQWNFISNMMGYTETITSNPLSTIGVTFCMIKNEGGNPPLATVIPLGTGGMTNLVLEDGIYRASFDVTGMLQIVDQYEGTGFKLYGALSLGQEGIVTSDPEDYARSLLANYVVTATGQRCEDWSETKKIFDCHTVTKGIVYGDVTFQNLMVGFSSDILDDAPELLTDHSTQIGGPDLLYSPSGPPVEVTELFLQVRKEFETWEDIEDFIDLCELGMQIRVTFETGNAIQIIDTTLPFKTLSEEYGTASFCNFASNPVVIEVSGAITGVAFIDSNNVSYPLTFGYPDPAKEAWVNVMSMETAVTQTLRIYDIMLYVAEVEV